MQHVWYDLRIGKVLVNLLVLVLVSAAMDGVQASEETAPFDVLCATRKQSLEDTVNFKFIKGYRAPVEGIPQDYMKEVHMNFSTYPCKAEVLDYQYLTPDGSHFDAKEFMTLVKDKTVAVIGDSLGIQTANGLFNELHPLLNDVSDLAPSEAEKQKDQWLDIVGAEFSSWQGRSHRYKAARRKSQLEWNSTLYFCNDATLEHAQLEGSDNSDERDIIKYCVKTATDSAIRTGGVIVLVVGPWWKPHYPPNPHVGSIPDTSAFTPKLFEDHLREFQEHIYNIRTILDKRRTNQGGAEADKLQVIWRLVSSSGHLSELDRAFQGKTHGFGHRDGALWTRITDYMPPGDIPGYSWAAQYNAAITAVAHHFDDYILNSWSLSHHLLRFVNHPHMHQWETREEMDAQGEKDKAAGPEVQIHADSLHYCAGSVQRAEALLLGELIKHGQSCAPRTPKKSRRKRN